jgi:hypothetical protein
MRLRMCSTGAAYADFVSFRECYAAARSTWSLARTMSSNRRRGI